MKRLLALLLVIPLLLSGCITMLLLLDDEDWEDGESAPDPRQEQTATFQPVEMAPYDPGDTWAIYWYLCGSDLETEGAFASTDLEELISVDLPDNVFVVVQTGGSNKWHSEYVDASATCRFLYDSSGLNLVDKQASANMGDPSTLADFLRFCTTNYPADHQAVILWDHGGGTAEGIIYDERYGYDNLSIADVRSAFASVVTPNEADPPFELVGFDACLMATIDMADAMTGIARYMVASEELEPALGWSYDGMLEALAANPGLGGAGLGAAICDSYYAACAAERCAGDVTLSVVDLTRLGPLMAAYHNIGVEALTAACTDEDFLFQFRRSGKKAENYGSNNFFSGYTNLVDLGDLVRNTAHLFPENANAVMDALNYCVVYQVNGPYRAQASGLSCFYSFNWDQANHREYAGQAASESNVHFSHYYIHGNLSAQGKSYIATMSYEPVDFGDGVILTMPEIPELTEPEAPVTIDTLDLEDHPLYVDDEGNAVLDIGAQAAGRLTSVTFHLTIVDYDEEIIVMLGADNNIDMDWDSGVFRDNFYGYWGAIDGCLAYMELTYEGEDYNLYSVPILLNGEEYTLRVSYDYNTQSYNILGARMGIDDYGMSDRNLRQLQPGDEVTTLLYSMSLADDGDEDLYQLEWETLTVSAATRFDEIDLGDGDFALLFEMVDVLGNSMLSDVILMEVEDDYIYFLEE